MSSTTGVYKVLCHFGCVCLGSVFLLLFGTWGLPAYQLCFALHFELWSACWTKKTDVLGLAKWKLSCVTLRADWSEAPLGCLKVSQESVKVLV